MRLADIAKVWELRLLSQIWVRGSQMRRVDRCADYSVWISLGNDLCWIYEQTFRGKN